MDDAEQAAQGLKRPVARRAFLAAAGLGGMAGILAACGSAPVTPSSPAARPGLSGTTPTGSAPPSANAEGSPASTSRPPSSPPPRDTVLVAENARPGNRGWDHRRVGGFAQAYLGTASVAPGGQLALRASGSGRVSVEWYRLGWYGGTGARLLRTDRDVVLHGQPAATIDPQTGMVEARWTPILETGAPADAPSGMLLAVLRSADGRSIANVPVILRPDPTAPRRAPVLFVSAAATWQGYNAWGGLDFYDNFVGAVVPATNSHRSAAVSFDRPHALDGGAGYLRRWELQFIRWMEREGRDVEYVADVDLELNPGLVDGRRLVVMAGHLEYWSRPMRSRIEAAIASGTHVAFLTANEVFWQTRLEDGPTGPGTKVVCYKSRTADPITATNPSLTTCRWREAPVSDPEAPLVGEMYGLVCRRVANWVVKGPDHWLYEGTRLAAGDGIRNLVGQEFDTFFADLAQPGTTILAEGPVDASPRPAQEADPYPSPAVHNATVYTAQSGATVIAAGTFQWSWAIDGYGTRAYHGVATPRDARVVRMTRNLFDRLGDGPLAP